MWSRPCDERDGQVKKRVLICGVEAACLQERIQMKRRLLVTARLAILISCCATSVLASGGRQVDIPERASGAQKVVIAKVTSATPGWRTNTFGDQLIVTEVSLDVEETLKGTPATQLWMDLEGGTVDGVTLRVSSLPQLSAGERAVFFLDGTPSGSHVPHLKGQGILKLDANNVVRGSSLRLDDVRRQVRGANAGR